MPVTIQTTTLKYKNGNSFTGVDCLKGDTGEVDLGLIAPDYSDLTFPVAKDTLCTHDGSIYKSNQLISTSEDWTAAHWDAVPNIASELSAYMSALNVLEPAATSGDVGKFLKAKTVSDGKVTEYEFGSASGGVSDVQVNGTSVVSQGVANVPVAGANIVGAVAVNTGYGLAVGSSNNLYITEASSANIKGETGWYNPITSHRQNESVFYGLAKAAGDSTQSSSNNSVGTYTESAKSAIHDMLDAPETVSGSTPSITAKAGIRYICGECSTLTIVVPASGCIDVVFESGSTATVLTVTPPSGVTAVKWANGFDPTSLDANTRYEILIDNGEWGMACAWT